MMRQPWDKMVNGSMNLQQKNPCKNDQMKKGNVEYKLHVTEISNASSMNGLMYNINVYSNTNKPITITTKKYVNSFVIENCLFGVI